MNPAHVGVVSGIDVTPQMELMAIHGSEREDRKDSVTEDGGPRGW